MKTWFDLFSQHPPLVHPDGKRERFRQISFRCNEEIQSNADGTAIANLPLPEQWFFQKPRGTGSKQFS
jgi:hypothetical protein